MEYRDRAQDGEQPVSILSFTQGASNLDHIAVGLDPVDVREIADMAANLGCEIRLQVFGASFLEQRVGMVFIGNAEFQPINHFADARRLLGGPVDDHGFIG